MKPAAFVYEAPESLEEALELLAEHGADAKPLAGGQSLMPLLNMRFAQPTVLVDLNRLRALGSITPQSSHIHVGATARQADFEASSAVRTQIPVAAAAMPYVGHFVTRNRGTVGGSLAHADARGELPLLLAALGGSAVVASRDRGERNIRAEELFVTHFTTSLESDELLVSSSWPTETDGWRFAFEEFAQRHGDYALGMVCAGAQIENGKIREARIAVSAVTDHPVCLGEAGELLVDQSPSPELARAAGAMARSAVDPHDDMHASAAYRRNLTGVLVERACSAIFGATR